MSVHTDDDDDELSQDENEQDIYQQDEQENDDLEANAFVTDDADIQLTDEQQQQQEEETEYDNIEPIEARPPDEINADEQERRQSGTPAFRTLDEV